MEDRQLTGLERELVIQYLKDDNVPVTISDSSRFDSAGAAVFPVAVKSEQLKVLDKGLVMLRDMPESIRSFEGKSIRVQFYFNRLGIYFITELRRKDNILYIIVPQILYVLEEKKYTAGTQAKAVIRFPGTENSGFQLEALPLSKFNVFGIPKWGDIELSLQKKAKSYLDAFIADAKKNSGVYLISVCRYFVETEDAGQMEKPALALDLLFADSEKIVFGRRNSPMEFNPEEQYSLQLTVVDEERNLSRVIRAICQVDKIYSSESNEDESNLAKCAVCHYVDLKSEDYRFLYEKSRGKILE